MNSPPAFPAYQKAAYLLLLAGLVIFFLIAGKELLIPVFIALLLTFLLLPVSTWLERWRFIPRWLAIILSILLAMLILGLVLWFFLSQLMSFSGDLPELKKMMNEKLTRVSYFFYRHFSVTQEDFKTWMTEKINSIISASDKIIFRFVSATGNFLISFGLVFIFVFFITLYRVKFALFISLLVSTDKKSDDIIRIIRKIVRVSYKYLTGLLLDIAILAALSSAGYLMLGLRHAILLGVLAALMNVIPYIGVLIGSSIPVLMALLTKDEISYAAGAAGVAMIVQFLDNNFIGPRIVGGSVSINPLAAIMALVTASMIWGIAGMILSIPLLGMIKVICDNVRIMQPYGFLIGQEKQMRKNF